MPTTLRNACLLGKVSGIGSDLKTG
jgi:hypothetical protein